METIHYVLVLIALYIIYKIFEAESNLRTLVERQNRARGTNWQRNSALVVRTHASEDSDHSDEELIRDLNATDAGNLETIVRILESAKKKGKTTIVQHITGPQNNNNVDLKFQLNIAPMPTIGSGVAGALLGQPRARLMK
ncbi:uncharacterized protein LOC142974119 [Anticarsia gemmatalis]|uniref:uncharacterized protein LOC142974119 n=1 Tax=Anticarsia gemmatalis TaxID=129554 RepID=UPI003F7605C3